MRTGLVTLLLAAAIAHLPSAANAAGKCPASAFKASQAVWPLGALPTGQTASARHPCGRRITYTGGTFGPRRVLRQCRWG